MNISGINQLVYYNNYGKRILLLGEAHITWGMCKPPIKNITHISDYIISLINEIPRNECLDIFLEGTYKTNFVSGDSSLGKTTDMLEMLIKTHKPKNLRVHYTDPRYIKEDNFTYGYQLGDEDVDIPQSFRNIVSESDLLNALDYLLTIDRKKNRKYFIKIFYH